jgi:transcriptional regulator with XRE-family HTH domain
LYIFGDSITLFVTKRPGRGTGEEWSITRDGSAGTLIHIIPQCRGATSMSLAQRVRDIRYSKGWGPDELANRAEISRTALYQIESGKTELPRAGTLRRIAVALDVPMEQLLEREDDALTPGLSGDRVASVRSKRVLYDWVPSEGGPLAVPGGAHLKALATPVAEEAHFSLETALPSRTNGLDSIYLREGELMSKLHDLLHSSLGEGVARIVDEMHMLLPRTRS